MVRYLIILHYVLLKQDSHGLRQVLPTPAGLMSATDMGVPSLPLNITSFLPGCNELQQENSSLLTKNTALEAKTETLMCVVSLQFQLLIRLTKQIGLHIICF